MDSEKKFLSKHIFQGLKNINDGFDAMSILYFSEEEFAIVLDRIEDYGIGVFGIEVWIEGDFYNVQNYETYTKDPRDRDATQKWYRKAFDLLRAENKNYQYSATYDVPEKLLK